VGDEHPAYAPAGAWLPLPFTFRGMKNWVDLGVGYIRRWFTCTPSKH